MHADRCHKLRDVPWAADVDIVQGDRAFGSRHQGDVILVDGVGRDHDSVAMARALGAGATA